MPFYIRYRGEELSVFQVSEETADIFDGEVLGVPFPDKEMAERWSEILDLLSEDDVEFVTEFLEDYVRFE